MRPRVLALKLLRRDWQSGELRTLIYALVVAVAAVASIGLITDRLTSAMVRESAELIGGDLVVDTTREPDPAWLQQGRDLGMATAEVLTFDSVVFHGDTMLLAGIKAVSDNYPLRGNLRVADTPGGESRSTRDIPAPGAAWVDPRVLDRLAAQPGDTVEFGTTHLRLEKVLTYEPDQGNALFQFAPRILINATDLEEAEVLGPGSRVRYRYLFAGDNVDQLREQLEPEMTTGYRLMDPTSEDDAASEALVRATQFIKLSALLVIVLAAIAIALAARRYSERHYDTSAMLRCLGAQQREITRLYLYQLLLFILGAALAGCALGWLVHLGLAAILQPALPTALPPPGPAPLISASATAALLVAGFALPPVLRLARMSPLRVFRRDLSPMPLSGWLVYGLALGALGLVVRVLFDDVGTVLVALALTVLAVFVTGCLIYLGLRRLRRSALARNSLLGRSIRNLSGHAATSTSQILAFGLALMMMVIISQLRGDLLTEWQLQLPADVPNYFAFNIQPHQADDFVATVGERTDMRPLYPVVRGRLTGINGEPVPVSADIDTHRELNLTWADRLPDDNAIVAGSWPPEGESLSIEKDYAQRLGVEIGDRLDFNSGGREFTARVSSLRTVVWESFSPNFFMIFSEATLGDLPATYLTSFRLEDGDRALLRELRANFPAATILEVDAILQRLQLILGQVSLAVTVMMVFVLLAGLAVLFAAVLTTADERLQEGALMRALGASRRYLRRAALVEFGLIGLLAGTLAIAGAEIAGYFLYTSAFGLDFSPAIGQWLWVPLAAATVIAAAGYGGTHKVVSVSPRALLE